MQHSFRWASCSQARHSLLPGLQRWSCANYLCIHQNHWGRSSGSSGFMSGSIPHLPYQSAVLHLCTLKDIAAEGLACHHGDGRDLKMEPFAMRTELVMTPGNTEFRNKIFLFSCYPNMPTVNVCNSSYCIHFLFHISTLKNSYGVSIGQVIFTHLCTFWMYFCIWKENEFVFKQQRVCMCALVCVCHETDG